jgi:murein DD-endopeptidase MepM/ murein hydrolase activator NlpD
MGFKELRGRFYRKNYYSKSIFQTNKYFKFLKKYTFFIRSLFFYLDLKVRKILGLLRDLLLFTFSLNKRVKSFVISKLIWSRGKLGKPVADFVVITATFLVFLIGGVLSSNKFVTSASASPDVFKNNADYIPQYQSTLLLVPEERKRNETIKYTVQDGDTLFSIGQKYKISADAIRYINNLADADNITIGQVLSIPPISGIIHKVKTGDSLASISKLYDVPSQAIADFNYLTDLSSLQIGSELVIPDAKIPQVAQAPSSGTSLEQVQFETGFKKGWCRWPTTSRIITQYYSWYHSGLDVATSWFSAMPPIFACAGGRVIRAGWDPTGYGIMVIVDHGNGYQTLYAHLSKLRVSYGDYVKQGDTIGIMGNTGRSTGPHLHFEVRKGSSRQNPLNHVYY